MGPLVAIVGTRRPSTEGAAFARRIARELACGGAVVASGGALGIDAEVHLGALEGGGKTLVVAPSSFDCPYPEANKPLFQRIVDGRGAYVCEFESETVARRHQFFRRNALLVALAALVVIVEAPLRSGARNAGLWARRLGRPLFVTPQAPWHSRGRGNLEELRLGASWFSGSQELFRALAERNQHLLGEVDTPTQAELPWPQFEGRPSQAPGLSAQANHLLSALSEGPRHLDALSETTQLSSQAIQSELLELTLSGRVELMPGGLFRRLL